MFQTKELCKSYGALRAVHEVTLDIGPGVHSIIGPNGAGKTTLFNLLTGFLSPTSGKIIYMGKDITGLPPFKVSQLGVSRSFQITSLFPDLTVYENIRIAVQSRLRASYNFLISSKSLEGVQEKTQNVLKQLSLTRFEGLEVRNLSYGLQRVLDIGISLATDPKLILLDEPTSGMDRADAKQVIQLVSEISTKIPIVLIEHNIDIVLSISDIITVMYQGTILAQDTPNEIQQNEKVQEAYLGGY
ncbi:MAG: ABC transporter ATP-binding protein [Desulfatiglandaceae bacterium]